MFPLREADYRFPWQLFIDTHIALDSTLANFQFLRFRGFAETTGDAL
jgi:hypothetical protein